MDEFGEAAAFKVASSASGGSSMRDSIASDLRGGATYTSLFVSRRIALIGTCDRSKLTLIFSVKQRHDINLSVLPDDVFLLEVKLTGILEFLRFAQQFGRLIGAHKVCDPVEYVLFLGRELTLQDLFPALDPNRTLSNLIFLCTV